MRSSSAKYQPLFPGLAARERFVDGGKPLRRLAGFAETGRQFAEQQQEARQKPRVACLFERAAQGFEARADVAAPGHQHASEAPRPQFPQPDRVAFGVFDQGGAITLGGIEIAGQIGDRACGLPQHAAEGQGMADGATFLDIALDDRIA